jgi:membrane-associated phospholipid phosphatase
MAAIWVFAALVPVAHWRDAVVLDDFTQLSRPSIDGPASTLLHLLDPLLYTVWALLIVAVALLRGRPRVALAVAVVLPAAPLSAELIKPLAAHQHAQVGYQWINAASWPSGHATAAMTLVLCALLVVPHRLRPTIAVLGSAFAVAVGFALLILAWHMPSDVLGGYLLAALFVSLALAALRAAEARRPSGAGVGHRAPDTRIGIPRARAARWRGEDLLAPATIVLAGALAFAGFALVRAGQVASFAGAHHLAMLAAAALAALVVLICSSLTLALGR